MITVIGINKNPKPHVIQALQDGGYNILVSNKFNVFFELPMVETEQGPVYKEPEINGMRAEFKLVVCEHQEEGVVSVVCARGGEFLEPLDLVFPGVEMCFGVHRCVKITVSIGNFIELTEYYICREGNRIWCSKTTLHKKTRSEAVPPQYQTKYAAAIDLAVKRLYGQATSAATDTNL